MTDQRPDLNDTPATPQNDDSAAKVIRDLGEATGADAPGGGTLIGGDAPAAGTGGTAPNAPIDTGVDAGDATAAGEARTRSVRDV